MASRTVSTRGCSADPLVEKLSMATRGSTASNLRQFNEAARAISASCSEEGSGTTAQSEKIIAPCSPKEGSGWTMRK